MHRPENTQATFADALLEGKRGQRGRNRRLQQIEAAVDWAPLERLLSGIHSARRGRPSYRPLTMFKALLLQQWNRLSDVDLEEALDDRTSYCRFVGLGPDEPVPDHSSFSRFRSILLATGLMDLLMAELQRQLDEQGLFIKAGTMLDATLVEAQVRRPPRSAGKGARSAVDPDAGWGGSQRGRRSSFGYKAHLAVDMGSALIRGCDLSAANRQESEFADALICGDERAVYADKAYESKARRAMLRALGINDRIQHRANKWHPQLPHWRKRRNTLIERRRRPFERVFSVLKERYGYRRARYRGLARNRLELFCKVFAYNLARAVALTAAA